MIKSESAEKTESAEAENKACGYWAAVTSVPVARVRAAAATL